MFDIKEFKSYIGNTGTLPTNRYYVGIPVPRVLFNSQLVVNNVQRRMTQFTEDLQFRAEAVRAPGVTINMTNVNRYGVGPIQKFPYNAQFTDTSMTFLADKESLVWIFFYNWMNNVFSFSQDESPDGNYARFRSNYMMDYVVDIKIYVYDYDGKLSTTVELIDAYPISMNDVNLAWGDNNQAKKITVSFAFNYWRMADVKMSDTSTRAIGPIPLILPTAAQTPVSVRAVAPDPMLNNQNANGYFNSITVPQGTQTPTFGFGS